MGVGVGVGVGVGLGSGLGLQLPDVNCPVGPAVNPDEDEDVEVTPGEGCTCAGVWQVCADRNCTENTHIRIPSKRCFFTFFLSLF